MDKEYNPKTDNMEEGAITLVTVRLNKLDHASGTHSCNSKTQNILL